MSAEMEARVTAVLTRYRVQKHYRASRDAKMTRHAVFDASGQLTEPKRYVESHAEARAMMARDIVALFKEST